MVTMPGLPSWLCSISSCTPGSDGGTSPAAARCQREQPSGRYLGGLNRYKTALEEPQKIRIQSKSGLEPQEPLIQAWARVPRCPPPALPVKDTFWQLPGMLGTDLWGLGIVSGIWLAVHNAISHWSNVSSA